MNDEKVKGLIVEALGVEVAEVEGPKLLRQDLGACEFDIVELTMLIEDQFEIVIDDESMNGWLAVQDVFDTVNKLTAH